MKLRIDGDLPYFWQWDLNRRIIIDDEGKCTQVHFSNKNSEYSLVCEIKEVDGRRVADVPNILLQASLMLNAYLCYIDEDGSKTTYCNTFTVMARPRPDDYVYVETPTRSWEAMERKVLEAIEQVGHYTPQISPDGVMSWTRSKDTLPEPPDPVSIVGPQGPAGPAGEKGDPGTSVTILGSYDTEDDLNAAQPVGKPGESYMVGGDLCVWSETDGCWKNVGRIQGPQGIQGIPGEVGPVGPAGPQGKAFEFADFTPEQLEALRGPQGIPGSVGPEGPAGPQGVPGTGFFTLSVDGNGDLWVYGEKDSVMEFEYDEETGDLYVVQEV